MEKALALSNPYVVEALEITLENLESMIINKYAPSFKGRKINIAPVLSFMKDKGLYSYLLMRRCIYTTAVEETIKVKGKMPINVEKNILPAKILKDDLAILSDFESYELLNVLVFLETQFKKKYKRDLKISYDIKEDKISSLIFTEMWMKDPLVNIIGAIEFCGREIPTAFNISKKTDHNWMINTVQQYDFIGKLLRK